MVWAILRAAQCRGRRAMQRGARARKFGLGAVLAAGLSACMPMMGQRPAPPDDAAGLQPSAQSLGLARYYARLQETQLSKGLLRTDGGGPDTPFDDEMLARNFEQLAFFDEYERGRGLVGARAEPGVLRRWVAPVRITVEFGASVPAAQQQADTQLVGDYAQRLARVTGHPISTGARGNFHVLVASEDDRLATIARVRQLEPNINPATLSMLRSLPRAIHCLVLAFSDPKNDAVYTRAIAIIRAEHPDLMRKSCVHEELAQGLGLANDSPRARPSIFNDDDEFALLTTQDEMLLAMLYDPRLRPGITRDQALPIVGRIAREKVGSLG